LIFTASVNRSSGTQQLNALPLRPARRTVPYPAFWIDPSGRAHVPAARK
jgi:hypothetical protein